MMIMIVRGVDFYEFMIPIFFQSSVQDGDCVSCHHEYSKEEQPGRWFVYFFI